MATSKPDESSKPAENDIPAEESKPAEQPKPTAGSKPAEKRKPMELNLRIDKKDRPDGKIQLTITVPVKTLKDVMKSAAFVLAMQNKLDLSNANMEEIEALVIETVGEAQYYAFANHYAMTAVTPHAISQKGIEPIMEPELSAVGQIVAGKDFTFIAVVTPKPSYELSSYDPVTVKIPRITVSEKEIDDQILNLAQQRAEIVADEDAVVEDGKEISISIKSAFKDDGEPIPNLTADRRYYQLSQGFLPPDFDEQIVGMKAGESRTFDFELPLSQNPDGSYGETRTVTTTVELQQVEKKVVPAITNAWVEVHIPEAKNVDGLREMLRQEGMEFKTREQENMKLFSAASVLAERFQGTIPDEFYEFMRGEMLANLNDQLKQNNLTLEQYVQNMGMETQQFNMMFMMQVRESLRQGFALDALARHRKITINEDDIVETLHRMAPGNEERTRMEFEGSGRMYLLREAAVRTKANLWLAETATYEFMD